MEGKPAGQLRRLLPVEKVPGEGAAQVGQVDPDLVGAAGVQPELHQAPPPAGVQHLIVGPGKSPLGGDHSL